MLFKIGIARTSFTTQIGLPVPPYFVWFGRLRSVQVNVSVNGKPHDLESGTTIAELLRNIGVNVQHVAVELNEQIVPRGEHTATALREGDRLEVVTFVGGG